MIRIALMLTIASLFGCASDASYLAYLEAHRIVQATAYQQQKPLVKIIAHEGKEITGLAGIEINLPVSSPHVEQQRPSEWAGVMSQALGVVGVVGGVAASGQAAVRLANAVGGTSAQIAGGIQAPAANVSTVSSVVTNESNSRNVTTTNEADSRNTASTTTANTTTTSTTNSNNPITETTYTGTAK